MVVIVAAVVCVLCKKGIRWSQQISRIARGQETKGEHTKWHN